MKRALIFVLLAACSALHPTQETALSNQVAVVEAFRADYDAIDCGGCESCVAMQGVLLKASAAGAGYDAFKADEDAHRAYLAAYGAATAVLPGCWCTQDAALCPMATQALSIGRSEDASIGRSLERKPWYQTLLDGFGG